MAKKKTVGRRSGPKPRRPKPGTEVQFAIDAEKAAQIRRCLEKGELRVSIADAKVSITEQGVLLDAYLWD